MQLGIESISFSTSSHVLDLADLAEAQGIDVGKYHVGIGQELMSVPAADEDIVTIAAEAAEAVLDGQDLSAIRTLLFATESGIDQSKSAGVYVQSLLGLPSTCRVVELKQACYSGTAALQFALALVARNPREKVLVIASDIARYDLDSSGEPTQGAAAVAMLVSATPKVVEIEPVSGLSTSDVMDFWRPNYRSTALVDGKYSVSVYMDALIGAWNDYRSRGGRAYDEFSHVLFHQPFTRMAVKAQQRLARLTESDASAEAVERMIGESLQYNRRLGNSYTASLWVGLVSLLENADRDLTGARLGFFSFGSGAVAEFFSGTVLPGYREALLPERHRAIIDRRDPVTVEEYRALHATVVPTDGAVHEFEHVTRAPFRLAGIDEHRRVYERVDPEVPLTTEALAVVAAS